MTMATKQEILKEKLADYLAADKTGKGEILSQIIGITGMNRKAVIRRLNELQMRRGPIVDHRGRPEVYDMRVTVALKELWETVNEICAERLHDQVVELVRVLKRDKMWQHGQRTTELLQLMSLGTMKNRIKEFTKSKGSGGKSSTKPSDLKEIIPIRRGPWDNPEPGFGEIDTVAHCGSSLSGDFAFSVQYTDIATIWTCLSGQWNKGQIATKQSIERIKSRLPFALKGIDPDSGSEFINWFLKDWCDQQSIQMTRIRPYYKNDHARIEQKNYTNIRDFLGYTRIEKQRKIKLLNQFYDLLEDYINFFLPSQKCIKKERRGSKYKRIYDKTQTAYARVLAHPNIPQAVKDQLTAKYAKLNPKILKEQIDRLRRQILAGTHY
jgi:hypothetical protein